MDLRPLGVTGMAAEEALERAGIALNHNMIPYDPQPPRVTSGIRIGTPAVTTRGMGPGEMHAIARMIGRVLGSMCSIWLCWVIGASLSASCGQSGSATGWRRLRSYQASQSSYCSKT